MQDKIKSIVGDADEDLQDHTVSQKELVCGDDDKVDCNPGVVVA